MEKCTFFVKEKAKGPLDNMIHYHQIYTRHCLRPLYNTEGFLSPGRDQLALYVNILDVSICMCLSF